MVKIPWMEKYRPKNLDDIVLDKTFVDKFKDYIQNPQEMPHLLFSGNVGAGKTSSAHIISKQITEDIMYINASEKRGIDTSREITNFCEMSPWHESKLKIVILDEFDNMTNDAQMSLKNTMEYFSTNTRFILTCNHISKVNEAIESRCATYLFNHHSKKDIAVRCLKILKNENVKPVNFERDIKILINKFYPDIRSIVGSLQQFTDNGVFKVDSRYLSDDYVDELLTFIKSGDWKSIQSKLCGSVPYESMLSCIFNNAESLSDKVCIDIMMCVSEGVKYDSMVADRQTNFIATVLQVMRILEVV
jgi:replication factor C small subunit